MQYKLGVGRHIIEWTSREQYLRYLLYNTFFNLRRTKAQLECDVGICLNYIYNKINNNRRRPADDGRTVADGSRTTRRNSATPTHAKTKTLWCGEVSVIVNVSPKSQFQYPSNRRFVLGESCMHKSSNSIDFFTSLESSKLIINVTDDV